MLVCKHDGLPVIAGPNGSYFHDNPEPLCRTIARDVEEEKARTIRVMDEAGTLPVKVEVDFEPAQFNMYGTRPKIRTHLTNQKVAQPQGCLA